MVFKSKTPLKFSKFLNSRWLTDVKDHEIKKPNIVVNISNKDAIISSPEPRKVLPPRKSTILQGNNTDFTQVKCDCCSKYSTVDILRMFYHINKLVFKYIALQVV